MGFARPIWGRLKKLELPHGPSVDVDCSRSAFGCKPLADRLLHLTVQRPPLYGDGLLAEPTPYGPHDSVTFTSVRQAHMISSANVGEEFATWSTSSYPVGSLRIAFESTLYACPATAPVVSALT